MGTQGKTGGGIRRVGAVAAGMALIVALSGLPASAARPVFSDHIKFRDDLHEVPPLTELCGFEVWHEEKVNVVERVFEDGTVEIRLSVHETLVNPATGEELEHHIAGTRTFQRSQRIEGDRLIVDIDARHVGLPSHWRKKGEGVLLRDAGSVELAVHEIVDISQDPPQLVEREIEIRTVHGPHPDLEMSEQEFHEFVCGALS